MQPQPDLQSQLHSANLDAAAFWEVTLPQGQSNTQQPSRQGQLKLMLCHDLQHSSSRITCAIPVSGAGFQLMLGTSQGGIQLVKAETTDQDTKLVTVRELKGADQSAGTNFLNLGSSADHEV